MPFMVIYKLNEDNLWHIPNPSNKTTECGKAITAGSSRRERIGGDTATIKQPSKDEVCNVCFHFLKS